MRHRTINDKLKVWRQNLEVEGFRLSRTKMKYLVLIQCCDGRSGCGSVMLATQTIPERERVLNILGLSSGVVGTSMMMSHVALGRIG